MLNNIKDFFEFASKNGIYLISAYDQAQKGPSVSLFFAHVSFWVTTIITICLACKNLESGAIAAMLQGALMLVFYLIRALTKAKFNLKDKSLDLEGGQNEKTEPK
jgi:hypothetical protein